MWSVVHFYLPEDNTVQLVPSCWVDINNQFCRWPTSPKAQKSIASLVKKCEQADESWATLPVKVIKTTDNYTKGKQIERRATTESNIESSDATEFPKKRFKRRQVRVSSKFSKGPIESDNSRSSSPDILSEEEENHINGSLHDKQEKSAPINKLQYFQLAPESGVNVVKEGAGSSQKLTSPPILLADEEIVSTITIQDVYSRQLVFERIVLKELAIIKDNVQDLLLRTASKSATKVQLPVSIPLKTKEDLELLENWTKNGSNAHQLVNLLGSYGGKNPQKVISHIFTNLFSKDLAVKINFNGSHNKIGFEKSPLLQIIIDGAKQNSICELAKYKDLTTALQNKFKNSRDMQ